jgi:8-oxoguanine deaminase
MRRGARSPAAGCLCATTSLSRSARRELPPTADTVLDLRDHVVLPGLVNTHHHLYQSLTRVMAQDADLFTWLKTLYPIWANLTDEAVYVSTITGLAELALSGCTTSSDHLYIFPNDCTLDSQIRAAADLGVRFHAARGSMSLGESQGGLPPDRVTEDEAFILRDSRRLIETYHDASRHAMTRVVLAPCSPFSVTADLMRESAALARAYGVRLHTHLAETLEEEAFCLETFGQRPVPYVESLGWTGDDVWHAHCVHMSQPEIEPLWPHGHRRGPLPQQQHAAGQRHRPVLDLRRAGAPVGLGVDGSASNDGGHLLGEARQAMLLQRVAPDRYLSEAPGGRGGFAGAPTAMSARRGAGDWHARRGGRAGARRHRPPGPRHERRLHRHQPQSGAVRRGVARPAGGRRLLSPVAGRLVGHQRPRRRPGRPADHPRPRTSPAPPQHHCPRDGERRMKRPQITPISQITLCAFAPSRLCVSCLNL